MLTAERKRTYHPFWMLGEVPMCTVCNKRCVVGSTVKTDGGARTKQYRYCPDCGKGVRTVFQNDEPK